MNDELEKALYKELKNKTESTKYFRAGLIKMLKECNFPDKAMYEMYALCKNKTIVSEEEIATMVKQLRNKYEMPHVVRLKKSEIPEWCD